MTRLTHITSILFATMLILFTALGSIQANPYDVVDTDQVTCYDTFMAIDCPDENASFFGQDAMYNGYQPNYVDNGDGTVTDLVTGLMWQKDPGDKMTYDAAAAGAETFNLAGYDDWRLPTIKELYSLIQFSGTDPSGYQGNDTSQLTPFIDTDYFAFEYGDPNAGERIIDAQFATSTLYVGTTFDGQETMFGVNFADGRIKGYPIGPTPLEPNGKLFFVLYVRGGAYGVNDFQDNGDGTITDMETGLMWMQNDSGSFGVGDDGDGALTWEQALEWAENLDFGGYDDWRLPNAKALQSIVDYTRSPQTTDSPAIDPIFNCTEITDEAGHPNYPFYWSGTTHVNYLGHGGSAAYVAFGEALGNMNGVWMDVHGAGAQRSDPKEGDPADYPNGHGPQGDAIRIYNYVRCVRDADMDPTGTIDDEPEPQGSGFSLGQNYPNPFNPSTTIGYQLPTSSRVDLSIYNVHGQKVRTLVDQTQSAGTYEVAWDGHDAHDVPVGSGIYFYRLQADSGFSETRRMLFLK